MFYYRLAFNRPLGVHYTYASKEALAIGTRVKARLHSTVMPAVVVAEEKAEQLQVLKQKNISIKTIEQSQQDCEYQQLLYTPELIDLATWMSRYYVCSVGQCLFTFISNSELKEKTFALPDSLISYFPKEFPTLNIAQQQAFDAIAMAMDRSQSKGGEYIYLHGVTGSGKTEVYLQSIQYNLSRQKQVIYLLPEIALLEQVLPLLSFRFEKKNIAVLHSRLSQAQKLHQWKRILQDEVSIVVGVRSAIFAPCKRLGQIIIDEESDSSYKSDKSPRYHARQVAMWRSKKTGSLLLMGSATPSLESWYSVQQNKIKCLSLPERVSATAYPHIQLVSFKQTRMAISETLEQAIHTTISRNKQVLLLVNKRGFSHSFLCQQCGEYFECPNCSVSLVSHRSTKRFMLCHHCGFTMDDPEICPQCGYVELSLRGWGTQRVEHEIKKLFPREKILRMDSDNTKKKGAQARLLLEFYHGYYSIMIGTQMIAKGINIPNLHLVGILFCDNLFTLPDFRSYERGYMLLEQAAGRASRFSDKGQVVIQTLSEDKSFFQHFIRRDQVSFYNEELQKRKQYNLSPFCRLLRLVFRGKSEKAVLHITEKCTTLLNTVLTSIKNDISFLGPSPCVLYKIAKNYRTHVILRSISQNQLLQTYSTHIAPTLSREALKHKVYIEVDPDPLNIM